ncbi:MAG: hypothetical protein PHN78_04015 [Dehalococcoidales bacterium]|nr:hypothetical protein [Dehalococcoidales bacterium]
MITTVTTVTTITTIAALGLTTAISAAMAVSLIIFLASRELAVASQSSLSLRIARFVSVGILPMVMAFIVIVAVKIVGFF